MARAQDAIGIEQVQPAFARRRDDQAERGCVAIGQEGEGGRAALDADEGRRDQDFTIGGLDCGRFLDRLFRCRTAGCQNAEPSGYKERSPQGPRTAKVRPG